MDLERTDLDRLRPLAADSALDFDDLCVRLVLPDFADLTDLAPVRRVTVSEPDEESDSEIERMFSPKSDGVGFSMILRVMVSMTSPGKGSLGSYEECEGASSSFVSRVSWNLYTVLSRIRLVGTTFCSGGLKTYCRRSSPR